MDALSKILELPEPEKENRGLLFTPREIIQQPETWRKSYQKFLALRHEAGDFLEGSGVIDDSGESATVFLIGAGTSDYIGRSLVHLLKQKWQREVIAVPSTDLLTSMDELVLGGRPYLWISFSRSGDSSEGVAVLQSALDRYPEIRHLIVTCNKEGRMAKEFGGRENVYCIVLDEEVNDKGLAMTSSFSNMIVTGQCLAHIRDVEPHGVILESLISSAQRFVAPAADMAASLSHEGYSKIYFLGTGPLTAVAVESGLKVMELTAGRIITMSESYLGVRHGPLSAVDEDTLVVAYLSMDERCRAYEWDLIQEVEGKKLARKVVPVLPEEDARANAGSPDQYLNCLYNRNISDKYRAPVDVIFGQLLGLFSSIEQGLKPDTPSPREAIGRVVSGVRLH
jgi:tagatose-6-phosphate ketose/aldose isomerase